MHAMQPAIKKIIGVAVVLIVAAACVRTCKSSAPSTVSKNSPANRPSSSTKSESTSFWSFLDGFFGGSDKQKSQSDDEIVEESKEGPLRSELNILSERLEKDEKLPESVWYPNSTDKEEVERHTALLREMLMLGTIVRAGTASSEQKDRYYDIKLKIMQDKLELIKDYRQRYSEFADPEDNDEIIGKLQNAIDTVKKEMKRR